VERLGSESRHEPLPGLEIKNDWSYSSTPHALPSSMEKTLTAAGNIRGSKVYSWWGE